MKKYLSNALKFVLTLGIGVALVYWFIGQIPDKQKVWEYIKHANYFWVLTGPTIGLTSNYFRSERWRILLQPLGYKPGAFNTFLSVMIMYFANLFFPRAGEVLRCTILNRYEKVPVDKAIGTMVLERLVDAFTLGIILLILLIAGHDKFISLWNYKWGEKFASTISQYQINPVLKYSVFAGVLVLIVVFVGLQIRKKGFNNIKMGLWERIKGLWNGFISIKDLDRPMLFIFHSVMIWLCYFLMIYLPFRMFPETANLGLLAGGMCLFFGGAAYTITPGGLGAYPLFIGVILSVFGVDDNAANSLGIVVWTAQTLAVLGAGVISLVLLAIINREPALEKVTLKT